MGKLLFNVNPVMVITPLAMKLGLAEAMVLQQIHYWLETSHHVVEGRRWVYNSYKEWQLQLPFWSESTIKRTIKSLEEQGYIVAGNFNRLKLYRTKWYSLEYEKLAELDIEEKPCCHTEQGTGGKDLPEQELQAEASAKPAGLPFAEIIGYLNENTNSSYRAGTRKSRELIAARWKEGFTLADFKRVIDLKAGEWLNDPKWSRYLRPETLFGTKFESYLNQKPVRKALREEDFDLDDEA